ncbi:hypothetical protein AM202_0274 [Actinobacillus minor 202]|uniref:Uncharacterized protein n=1 Tax=Actinobacillus minor 202 TaxID=591023 RepID=A0ABP2DLX8_9PAST|nr:hypothetical protein [Actinobacillus minor]EEF15944.1 hypothetical protein AM202_0274 [Actinobacillus minor 202]
MRFENFIVNRTPNPSNLDEMCTSTCTLSYKIKDSVLYIYAYQNKDMGKFGWLNIYLEDTIERAIQEIERTQPDNRNCLQKLLAKDKKSFNQLVVVTTLDGVEGIPTYEIYLDNLDEVKQHTSSREALIRSYPVFNELI